MTANGNVTQPIQWSSEYYDAELGLVYYNYRHYCLEIGAWLSKDSIEEQGGYNLYTYNANPVANIDIKGNIFIETTVKIHPQLERPPYPGVDVIRPESDNWQSVVDAIDSDVYCWQCIGQLNIKIHGDPSMAIITKETWRNPEYTGDVNSDNAMVISNVNLIIDKLLNQESFCSECIIFFLSCNTGLSSFVQPIARKTGCIVYAPMGYIAGDLHNPIDSKIVREIQDQRLLPCPGSKDNTFRVFYPDGRVHEYNNRPN